MPNTENLHFFIRASRKFWNKGKSSRQYRNYGIYQTSLYDIYLHLLNGTNNQMDGNMDKMGYIFHRNVPSLISVKRYLFDLFWAMTGQDIHSHMGKNFPFRFRRIFSEDSLCV